ncbi:zinc-ribbon domain-containing protein [Bacillus pseudomycoides]|uniref:zinc-ribbon domain-containing protein n=1 Tax=Bacillus pseudomycoides TaxID=64104 RepID=UPI0020D1F911|nr:zinc-ribbon domain-containing protein [Bacillus pseudomycoides]
MDNSLAKRNPELAKQWHETKNGKLTPFEATLGSSKKVWWKCEKGHEWEASPANRHQGKGCPYCSNQKVCIDNCLATLNPEIAKEWHPTKNGKLTPFDITFGSSKKAWWKCEKRHEWETKVCNRTQGNGCPYCTSRKVCIDNCLATLNPELAKEWHLIKNGELTPYDVMRSSNKKAWWKCEKGHEWEASPWNRHKGRGCPYCSNKKVCIDNCLATLNPEIAKEWHPTKNGKLTPYDVVAGSYTKVWWMCNEGHEWETQVRNRTQGNGCPYCCGQKTLFEKSIVVTHPELLKEWHLSKNIAVDFSTISFGSERKVWWKCKKGHEWETSVYSRTRKNTGCPYCSGRNATIDNCLAYIYPEIAKEWHPTKNGTLTPYDVTPKSGKRVWWVCEKGHEWQTTVHQRGEGTNCPFCKPRTSFPEQAIFYFIKKRFKNTLSQHITEDRVEFDIFNSGLSFVIEYDGYYWHRKRYEQDVKKSNYVAQKGFLLIRVREEGLQEINNNSTVNIFIRNRPSFNELNRVISKIFKLILQHNNFCYEKMNIDTEKKKYEIIKLFKKKEVESSIAFLYPHLVREWHPTKNNELKPEHFKKGSQLKVWWKCEKGHEWESAIHSRSSGVGCPYCTNRKACIDNCLATLNPEIAKEWHPTKNGTLTPYDIVVGSYEKVWWKCMKGHEWETKVCYRTQGSGCPYCTNRKICIDNCLATLNPDLAKEWHPTKNGKLTPYDVTRSSSKKVWWKCNEGHEWEVTVNHRAQGHGCLYCSRKNKKINYKIEN